MGVSLGHYTWYSQLHVYNIRFCSFHHCRVIESKYGDFAVGDLIVARIGWQTHAIANASVVKETMMLKIDPSLPFSPSTALGVLGMPG